MVQFTGEIERITKNGEKKGWFYLVVSSEIAAQIKPGNKKFFRARGTINGRQFSGLGLLPAGTGEFILPVNAGIRKALKVDLGAMLYLSLEEDKDFEIAMPEDLEICLGEEPHLLETFFKFSKAHQHYFINWINAAKTEPTRTKRIALTVEAMDLGLDYGAMIRRDQARRNNE